MQHLIWGLNDMRSRLFMPQVLTDPISFSGFIGYSYLFDACGTISETLSDLNKLCVSLERRHFPRVPRSQPGSSAFPFVFRNRNSWLSVFILQLIIHHLCCCGCDLAACKSFSWSWIWRLDYEMTIYDSLLVFPVWSSFSVLDITLNLVCSLSFFLNILTCPFSSSEPPIKHCRSDGASQVSTALFTFIHSG